MNKVSKLFKVQFSVNKFRLKEVLTIKVKDYTSDFVNMEKNYKPKQYVKYLML